MSFDPLSAAFQLGGKLLDRFFPDPAKRAEAQVELLRLQQTGELAHLASETDLAKGQIAINVEEAKHSSFWVAGWRPCVGWVGAAGLAYAAILEPLARFVATLAGYTGAFPVLDTTITMQLLFGLLGLGGFRTYEKSKGVAAK
jgi:hypothetical protein